MFFFMGVSFLFHGYFVILEELIKSNTNDN